MISLEKLRILTPFENCLKCVGDLGKIIIAPGFEKLPKVSKITQSGHTVRKLKVFITLAMFQKYSI